MTNNRRKWRPILLAAVLVGLLFVLGIARVQAGPISPAPLNETWRTGFNFISGGLPNYGTTIGQFLSPSSVFSTTETYFAFPARGFDKRITSAQVYLLSRVGSTTLPAVLTLYKFSMDGASGAALLLGFDLKTAPLNQWIPLPIYNDPLSVRLKAGEYLAFRFLLGATPASPQSPTDNLVIQAMFEVNVKQSQFELFLPTIRR